MSGSGDQPLNTKTKVEALQLVIEANHAHGEVEKQLKVTDQTIAELWQERMEANTAVDAAIVEAYK